MHAIDFSVVYFCFKFRMKGRYFLNYLASWSSISASLSISFLSSSSTFFYSRSNYLLIFLSFAAILSSFVGLTLWLWFTLRSSVLWHLALFLIWASEIGVIEADVTAVAVGGFDVVCWVWISFGFRTFSFVIFFWDYYFLLLFRPFLYDLVNFFFFFLFWVSVDCVDPVLASSASF